MSQQEPGEVPKPSNIFSAEEKQRLASLRQEVDAGERNEFVDPDEKKLEFFRSIREKLQEEEGISQEHASVIESSAGINDTSTHITSSVLTDAEAVAHKQWGSSPSSPDQSITYKTEEQILAELRDVSPEQADPQNNEPLPTKEREEVREMYQSLMSVLPHFGFDQREIEFGTSGPYYHEFNVFGIPGKLGIHIGRDVERNDENNVVKEKSKYLIVKGTTQDKKGELKGFEYMLDNNGLARDKVWGGKGIGYIDENGSENAQELLSRMQAELTPWIEAMHNPDYSPEQIREKVLAIRESLVAHLSARGIVPKVETQPYHFNPNPVVSKFFEANGIEDGHNEQQTYQLSVGHEYEIGAISDMEGEWVVQFETDQDNPLIRADGRTTDQEQTHGQGIIISKIDHQQRRSHPLERRAVRYEFWENGDIWTPNGYIGFITGYGPGDDEGHTYNPHAALSDAYRLQHALTGSPLPKELTPPEKPSRISTWINKFKPKDK